MYAAWPMHACFLIISPYMISWVPQNLRSDFHSWNCLPCYWVPPSGKFTLKMRSEGLEIPILPKKGISTPPLSLSLWLRLHYWKIVTHLEWDCCGAQQTWKIPRFGFRFDITCFEARCLRLVIRWNSEKNLCCRLWVLLISLHRAKKGLHLPWLGFTAAESLAHNSDGFREVICTPCLEKFPHMTNCCFFTRHLMKDIASYPFQSLTKKVIRSPQVSHLASEIAPLSISDVFLVPKAASGRVILHKCQSGECWKWYLGVPIHYCHFSICLKLSDTRGSVGNWLDGD